ncbi:MAG: hypothetical protein ACTTJS_04180 [Wolinella sp.]
MILHSPLEMIRKRAIASAEHVAPYMSIMQNHGISMRETFALYIFMRIKIKNPSRHVTYNGSYICIHGECNKDSLYIYPVWRFIDEPLTQLEYEIREAVNDIAKDKKSNIYITYPRIQQSKHITVQSSALKQLDKHYSLKLVPYVCDLDRLLNIKKGNYYEKNSNFLR